jgi:hypothetical protein
MCMLQAYISNVSMFQCFRGMLQVFYTDVAKIDLDVAFVAKVCTCMLQASVPNVSSIFQTYVASVSSAFFYMLQVLYLNVSKVDLVLHMLLGYIRMFQVFHLFQAYVVSVSFYFNSRCRGNTCCC